MTVYEELSTVWKWYVVTDGWTEGEMFQQSSTRDVLEILYRIKVQNEWSYSFSHMEDVLSRLRCSTTTDKNKREKMSNVFFYIYLQHYRTWNRFDY